MSKGDNQAEVITARWANSPRSDQTYFGTIDVSERMVLRFPILETFEDMPVGTNVFWGIGDDLRRYTALTLPLGPPGTTSSRTERILFNETLVTHLLAGDRHLADPEGEFISEISFTPLPNKNLHIKRIFEHIQPSKDVLTIELAPSCPVSGTRFASSFLAYFATEQEPIFDVLVAPVKASVSAWIGGNLPFALERGAQSHIGFSIGFETPITLQVAIDEALRFSTLLSFISHQYVYPAEFRVGVQGEETPYRLFTRLVGRSPEGEENRVQSTLILPDQFPAEFCDVMQKWYATNDQRLRGRFLYRYSLSTPDTYSTERFLCVFQAVEGILPKTGYRFLNPEEFKRAEDALLQAFPEHPKISALIGKLRSNNVESLKYILSTELPRMFAKANLVAGFDMAEFVNRIYLRRSKSSHGGSHLDQEPLIGLMQDTLLLSAIYVVFECDQLGLNSHGALRKFRAARYHELPIGEAASTSSGIAPVKSGHSKNPTGD
jgi:hypothetical protein